MSSEDDSGADLMASFKKGSRAAPSPKRKEASVSPGMFFSDDSSVGDEDTTSWSAENIERRVAIAVRAAPVKNREEYTYYEPKDGVDQILREYRRKGGFMYKAQMSNGQTQQVTFDELLTIEGGPRALKNFQQDPTPTADDASSATTAGPEMRLGLRRKPKKAVEDGFVDSAAIDISEDELARTPHKPRQSRIRVLSKRGKDSSRSRTRSRWSESMSNSDSSESSDDDDDSSKRRRKRKLQVQEPIRRSGRVRATEQDYDDMEGEDEDNSNDFDILRSDIVQIGRKRKRNAGRPPKTLEKVPRIGVRQSDRATRARNNMEEANVNDIDIDIYRSDSEPRPANAPKIVGVREVFETLPRNNLFRSRHVEGCEVCSKGPTIAPLIYCQGCSLAYHKNCLGNRSSRDHLVTKIGHENFVLQCKRCINFYKRKDPTAPDLSKCQDCYRPGAACRPFKSRKTPAQEQKEREDNDGQDPVTEVSENLINNAVNVLFRCTRCSRAYHYHHLPPLSQYSMVMDRDEEETADERFQEYARHWSCKDCNENAERKVSGIIAWRPSDLESFLPGTSCDILSEDDKQYLIKWENQSYFQASWHSGAWTWGVTASAMRKAFYKREDGPKMRTEDAIPEEFLRIDIVLSVKYTSYVEVHNEEIDKARIKEVDRALIKYKGLGYEDAVWEKVPTPEDADRWLDFVTAYNAWVAGRYVRYPKQGPLKARLDKARGTAFAKLEKQKQPDNLVGGELMNYQIEGLNWLYYQWYSQKNGILADEMGLGKTIQVIGFMATLIQEHNCFPFLVVVPNSTCANWRREIKQWAPSLRVVTFFGSAAARNMAYKYEMYPEGTKELRCHIVVTSYEAASDDSCRRVFRGVNWAGLIVDEGQRLKNDKSQLYGALGAVRAPFRLLLTGTPLQNNARELFNLLQFLDDTINAAELEERYAEMTSDNIRELHDQIRPFILRRTKAQVLTFLPPLGQIIVPISMSHLQKNLYKSILAKNPDLLKALFTSQKALKTQERANLNNILMQLRKCLCHPFVYSREIEERTEIAGVSHRNLVEASAKLQMLELLLPKLKERGHRVLIFSQFLDMLSIIEDFLDGMQMAYQRLDGTIGSLEKQKRIDQYNAPDSPLFAFLLSTRAGGVGINLASADTVIILDPDFNPHQDLQAISRAHRIGQKKKVLCFQLMTRASVEEKIVQMGRKKMALDHVVVEQLDAEDIEDKDVESILKYGATELFKDNNVDHDIRYDDASIDKLLDRSQIENTKTSDDNSAESQFSFARVWANEQGALEDTLDTPEEEVAPDPGVWDKILKERQAAVAAEALARADALGRGKRARMNVAYNTEQDGAADAVEESPVKIQFKGHKKKKKKNAGSESDTDFQVDSSNAEEGDSATEAETDAGNKDTVRPSMYNQNGADTSNQTSLVTTDKAPIKTPVPLPGTGKAPIKTPVPLPGTGKAPIETPIPFPETGRFVESNSNNVRSGQLLAPKISTLPDKHPKLVANTNASVKPFVRAQMPVRIVMEPAHGQYVNETCYACRQEHPRGACPLKKAGVEHCGLCGLAHYGYARTCPHIRSETQVRDMLEALKNSPEKKDLVEAAMKYLRGVKGHLVQAKKKDREKVMTEAGTVPQPPQHQGPPGLYQGLGGVNSGLPASVPPQHQVPPTYAGPVHAGPGSGSGSVGSYLAAQHGSASQQQQRPQGGVAQPPGVDDQVVESALRGYLSR